MTGEGGEHCKYGTFVNKGCRISSEHGIAVFIYVLLDIAGQLGGRGSLQ